MRKKTSACSFNKVPMFFKYFGCCLSLSPMLFRLCLKLLFLIP